MAFPGPYDGSRLCRSWQRSAISRFVPGRAGVERFRVLDHQELNPIDRGTAGLTWRRNGSSESMVRWIKARRSNQAQHRRYTQHGSALAPTVSPCCQLTPTSTLALTGKSPIPQSAHDFRYAGRRRSTDCRTTCCRCAGRYHSRATQAELD